MEAGAVAPSKNGGRQYPRSAPFLRLKRGFQAKGKMKEEERKEKETGKERKRKE